MKITYLLVCMMGLVLTSCDKILDIKPVKLIITDNQFATDSKANDAVVGIYSVLNGPYGDNIPQSINSYTSVSSDELIFTGTNSGYSEIAFNANSLTPVTAGVQSLWSQAYSTIYQANSVIDNVALSTGMTATGKTRATGEAKFLRAFCYFYLVNMFGDVPLVTTSDYHVSATLGRSPGADVYKQIISDLTEAANNLSDTYYTAGRVRANKSAALALLARVYLYTGDYVNAQAMASQVIANSKYSLPTDYKNVFINAGTAASTEAILQLTTLNGYTSFGSFASSVNSSSLLSTNFLNSFEVGDKRLAAFTNSTIRNKVTIYYPYKYRNTSQTTNTTTEYSMVLRLAEQYLIRAEAKAQQNDIAGAVADVNTIRTNVRVGLPGLSTTISQADLLLAIEKERRIELCYEWGDRWFNLKRTGRINAVLSLVKPGWKPTAALFPVPLQELINNYNLIQNPGY